MCELMIFGRRYLVGSPREAFAVLREVMAALDIPRWSTARDRFGDLVILVADRKVGHIAKL